ncbi:hypothetical protein U1Q18_040758 [Sarracenia purpurea var. burkii]
MAEIGASVAAVGFSKHGGAGVLFLGLLWLSAASVQLADNGLLSDSCLSLRKALMVDLRELRSMSWVSQRMEIFQIICILVLGVFELNSGEEDGVFSRAIGQCVWFRGLASDLRGAEWALPGPVMV